MDATTTTAATMQTIIDAAEYEYYGLRATDDRCDVGSIMDDSMIWVDGEPTDEEAEGACAVNISRDHDLESALVLIKDFSARGMHVHLVGCYYMSHGDEAHTMVAIDAVALAYSHEIA